MAKGGAGLFHPGRIERKGIRSAPDADRLAILRRLYLDLIGLPPTADQVDAFIDDRSDQAMDRVVDQLLDSPRFGERWGRHWLDLVRYAESRGHEFDNDVPNAFQYRDYIIRALNADVPYDQLIREHIAGDLIRQPRLHPDAKFNESVLGTGFWFFGEWVHSPVDIRKDEADRFDNMIDVMSKTFLGVTVACARCHDHKFDAISTADYYSLSGFLQSSDYRQVRFESMEQNRIVARQLADLDDRYQRQILELLETEGIRPPGQTRFLQDDSVVIDYGKLSPGQFIQDGFIFGSRPRQAGEAYLRDDGENVSIAKHGAAGNDCFWHGLESITAGKIQNKSVLTKVPKSGRTLRTPTFELTDGKLACLVEGRGHVIACVDSHRMVHGPLHGQTVKAIQGNDRWVRMDLDRYVGHRLHLEFVPADDALLAVRLVVQGVDDSGLKRVDQALAELDRDYERFAKAAQAYLNGTVNSKSGTNHQAQNVVSAWRDERETLRSQVVFASRLAPAMLDGTGEDDRILIRGNASKPGAIEPRHFLSAVAGNAPMAIASGSGRLELAERINDPDNPLTSRVLVNRLWHHLMGRGIVASTDDFGVLGQRPTHAQLLDHLASKFMAQGRSIKSMIKYLVLSRTYQMSTEAHASSAAADPKNLYWHYHPPRRLEGEAIRDSLLALSGELDPALFGPSVPVHLTPFMDGRGRPKGERPSRWPRPPFDLYLRAAELPGALHVGIRRRQFHSARWDVVMSPTCRLRPLILMNDPFVVQQARAWAQRAIKRSDDDAQRVRWMYRTGFVRQPTNSELAVALRFVGEAVGYRALGRFRACLDQYQRVYLSQVRSMDNHFPCQRYRPRPVSRREMLRCSASGFGALALSSLGLDRAFADRGDDGSARSRTSSRGSRKKCDLSVHGRWPVADRYV